MRKLVLDLELEQPSSNPNTPDSQVKEPSIIQIGYVIVDTVSEEILLKRSVYVNIGVPLSNYIKKLTGITDEQVANGLSIEDAFQVVVNDSVAFGCLNPVVQWGSGDVEHLQYEANMVKFGRSGMNIKHLYQVWAEANGVNTSGGLSKALSRIGIGWVSGRSHDALNDAINTARMYLHLRSLLKVGK